MHTKISTKQNLMYTHVLKYTYKYILHTPIKPYKYIKSYIPTHYPSRENTFQAYPPVKAFLNVLIYMFSINLQIIQVTTQ